VTRRIRPILVGVLPALALLATGLGACGGGADDADLPDELRGWSRSEVLGHTDVADYDRMAAASDGRRTAWLTRARGDTDILGVAEWSAAANHGPQHSDLTMLDGIANDLVVPSAMAVDGRGWTAVAELKDEPGGRAAALAVWASAPGTPGPPATLTLPDGHVLSQTIAAARTVDVTVVVALTGPAPGTPGLPEPTDLVIWTTPVAADGTIDAGGWQRAQPELGRDGPLATAGVVGAGDAGLVLAGTTDDGTAGVWTSTDGSAWEPVPADLPDGAGALDLLAPLGDGTALVGWATGESGRAVELWRLDGSDLAAAGTVAGPSDGGTVDLTDAAAVGERLVAGGSTRRGDTWSPMLWASTADADRQGEGEWTATDQAQLVGHLDWSVEALAADGEDHMAAVMASAPFHVDVATWTWSRPS
jgi:hypothetical protein